MKKTKVQVRLLGGRKSSEYKKSRYLKSDNGLITIGKDIGCEIQPINYIHKPGYECTNG